MCFKLVMAITRCSASITCEVPKSNLSLDELIIYENVLYTDKNQNAKRNLSKFSQMPRKSLTMNLILVNVSHDYVPEYIFWGFKVYY